MHVTFVLPFAFWTGGVRAVYEYARRLRSRGNEVAVVFPFVPYRFRTAANAWGEGRAWVRGVGRNLVYGSHPPGTPVRWNPKMLPWITDRFLPDADVVVATAWPTAYSVNRLAPRKGAKCYLIQHREIDGGPMDLVDATYRMPLYRIAGSNFSDRLLQRELGVTADAVAQNGVDTRFWRPEAQSRGQRSGVLMAYMLGARKAAAEGIEALTRVHRARPETPIRAFGQTRDPLLPNFVEYHRGPSDDRLKELYGAAQVFLYCSRYEGFGLPPLEALAAGCAVVSTRVGDVPEFVVAGSTGLLVEPGDIDGMAAAVLELLDDPDRCESLGRAGVQQATAYDWERATDRFEQTLTRALAARGRRGRRHVAR